MISWPLLLWVCGKIAHYGEECTVKETVYVTEDWKQKEKRKRSMSPHFLHRNFPGDLTPFW
jgi:hypothetical protein